MAIIQEILVSNLFNVSKRMITVRSVLILVSTNYCRLTTSYFFFDGKLLKNYFFNAVQYSSSLFSIIFNTHSVKTTHQKGNILNF